MINDTTQKIDVNNVLILNEHIDKIIKKLNSMCYTCVRVAIVSSLCALTIDQACIATDYFIVSLCLQLIKWSPFFTGYATGWLFSHRSSMTKIKNNLENIVDKHTSQKQTTN